MKTVTSRDNALFKRVKGLAHSARERRKAGLALLEGTHLVAGAIEAYGDPLNLIVSETAARNAETAAVTSRCGESVRVVFSDTLFAEVSTFETPAGIMALIDPPQARAVAHDADACLALEDIQDPGNLGAILRSAAAAGMHDVLLSPGCAFAWAPKVLRAGQGAHFRLNIAESQDLAAFAAAFAGQVLALDPHARKAIYDVDLRPATAFMIGNEGSGLTPQLLEAARLRVAIPMPGGFESLNAAAAAAVCLFELARQRR